MACLAGVLMIVAYNMSEWRTFRSLMRNSKSDVAVLITTFLLTVIFDLTIAVEIGLLMAILLFIKRISETSTISVLTNKIDTTYAEQGMNNDELDIPKGVEVYEIEGPFFFGLANKFDEIMKQMGDKPRIRIIRMRNVPFIDSTGIHNLENLIRMSHKENITILLSGVNQNVKKSLETSKINQIIGDENVCSNINQAMQRANQLMKITTK
jgi:SulP family sulfate permease